MTGRLLFIKWVHSVIAFFLMACLIYILYAGITATFSVFLPVAIATILVEGVAISLNKQRCPLTTLAEKYGAKKGSIADIFMPKIIADNLFKWTPFLFAGELVLVGVRYFGA